MVKKLVEKKQNQNKGVITLTKEQQKFLRVKSKVSYMIICDIEHNFSKLQFILSECKEYSSDYLRATTIVNRVEIDRILVPIEKGATKITAKEFKTLKSEFKNFPEELQKLVNEFKSKIIAEQYEEKIAEEIAEEFAEKFAKAIKELEENLEVFTNVSKEIYQFILEIEKTIEDKN